MVPNHLVFVERPHTSHLAKVEVLVKSQKDFVIVLITNGIGTDTFELVQVPMLFLVKMLTTVHA